jgi:SAM-dependent methyltransferase
MTRHDQEISGPGVASKWGARAAELYDGSYADRYREHDTRLRSGELVTRFGGWLRAVCERFTPPIDALDLGCGTGRYFHALRGVRRLVGIDVSAPMLERALTPVDGASVAIESVELLQGDFLQHAFAPGEFDLVYSIGVLAEHSPFDEAVAGRVRTWLRPGGRFAFSAVHPLSFSVPTTMKRRIGAGLLPIAGGWLRRALRSQLMRDGLYADEERLRDVLDRTGFVVESLEPYESDVHLHLLTVARRAA